MKQLFLLFATLCASFFVSSATYAVDPYVLTVAPSVSDTALDPGQSATVRVTIANQGSEKFNLQVAPTPYSVANDAYDAVYTPLPGRTSVVDWLTIAGTSPSLLEAGEYYDLELTIDVPAGTPPGGYSASVLVETSAGDSTQSGILAAQRVAHIVYITVNGDVVRTGDVIADDLPWVVLNTEQQTIDFSAQNKGGSNEIASTGVKVTDIFGRLQYEEARDRYVLPGTRRTIGYTWQPQGVFGVYKIERSCEIAGTTCQQSASWQLYVNSLLALAMLVFIGMYTGFMWHRRSQKRKRA